MTILADVYEEDPLLQDFLRVGWWVSNLVYLSFATTLGRKPIRKQGKKLNGTHFFKIYVRVREGFPENVTPLKTNMEHNHEGLVQIIFLSKWVIWSFQPLIFQGVLSIGLGLVTCFMTPCGWLGLQKGWNYHPKPWIFFQSPWLFLVGDSKPKRLLETSCFRWHGRTIRTFMSLEKAQLFFPEKTTSWWSQICFICTPYFGKWSNLTSIFFKWLGSTTNQKNPRSTIQLPRLYEKSVRAFLFEQSEVPWLMATRDASYSCFQK